LQLKKLVLLENALDFIPTLNIYNKRLRHLMQKKAELIGRHFVYIDETGFSSNVRPTYGYSKRGSRLHIRFMPTANEKKHTSVVAVADAQTGIVTTQLIQGHYTTALFVTFLLQLNFPPNTVLRKIKVHLVRYTCTHTGTLNFPPKKFWQIGSHPPPADPTNTFVVSVYVLVIYK